MYDKTTVSPWETVVFLQGGTAPADHTILGTSIPVFVSCFVLAILTGNFHTLSKRRTAVPRLSS